LKLFGKVERVKNARRANSTSGQGTVPADRVQWQERQTGDKVQGCRVRVKVMGLGQGSRAQGHGFREL